MADAALLRDFVIQAGGRRRSRIAARSNLAALQQKVMGEQMSGLADAEIAKRE